MLRVFIDVTVQVVAADVWLDTFADNIRTPYV